MKSFPTNQKRQVFFNVSPYREFHRIGLRGIRTDAVGSQHTCGRAERTPAVSRVVTVVVVLGPQLAPGCVFWMFFFGGAKNEDGCFCFFVSEGGEFFGEQ